MSLGRRRWMSQLKQEDKVGLPPQFVLFRPSVAERCPCIMRTIFLTQSTNSNANLCWRHPSQIPPGNVVLPALWLSLSPVKLTHKLNHHNILLLSGNGLGRQLSASRFPWKFHSHFRVQTGVKEKHKSR
uniref:Uncharacterized protein n=1 Tax=Myotis myotis TaxID=51298 RepID=A0A7J7Y0M1_MYOMY|nr:hypothetical protein mMyoMyo1_011329 [Myotis myotis]